MRKNMAGSQQLSSQAVRDWKFGSQGTGRPRPRWLERQQECSVAPVFHGGWAAFLISSQPPGFCSPLSAFPSWVQHLSVCASHTQPSQQRWPDLWVQLPGDIISSWPFWGRLPSLCFGCWSLSSLAVHRAPSSGAAQVWQLALQNTCSSFTSRILCM